MRGSWLAPGMLGDGIPDLGEIVLLVTKMCFEIFAGTIMCYGQTGAGKTYTMTGAIENYKHRGIIPRAIQQVESGPMGGKPCRTPLSAIDAAGPRPATGDSGVQTSKDVHLAGKMGHMVGGSAEASGSWKFEFEALTHARAEAISSFVREGVRNAGWLLATPMVYDPIIED